jgi:cytochrome P450
LYRLQGTIFAINDDELERGQRLIRIVNPLPELVLDVCHPHKAARERGDVVRTTLSSQRYYLLSNPDHVRHVLQDKNYVKGCSNAHLRVSTA